MNKMLFLFAAVAVLTSSCANSYSVTGSSSVSSLDGSKLYLKAVKNNELKTIDSCDVVHGQFEFSGALDTVRMVSLYMDDESIMPIVLEKGDITINIDNASQNVSGTPLNDLLYEFISQHNRLDNQMSELSHKQSRMMLDGIDEALINEQLAVEAARITKTEDSLVTSFIVENFDNVLGPGVFMMVTSRFKYPILTPQIEHIMSKATDKFKNNPYVKDYYQTATENEARMQGLDPSDISGMTGQPQQPAAETEPAAAVDTTAAERP